MRGRALASNGNVLAFFDPFGVHTGTPLCVLNTSKRAIFEHFKRQRQSDSKICTFFRLPVFRTR